MSVDLAKVLTGWLRLIDYDNDCEKIIEANPCERGFASLAACIAQRECETGYVHKKDRMCGDHACINFIVKNEYSACHVGKEFLALTDSSKEAQECASSLNRAVQRFGESRKTFQAIKIKEGTIFGGIWRIEIAKPE